MKNYRGFAPILILLILAAAFVVGGGAGWYTRVNSGAVHISSLFPSSGPVIAVVTIHGSGFTATQNAVSFTKSQNAGSRKIIIRNIDSIDGTTLRFIVPDQYNPCSNYQDFPCARGAFIGVPPGSYIVQVRNPNGTSNSLVFTVTSRRS